MPKNGLEPVLDSYKEHVLPIKLFRPTCSALPAGQPGAQLSLAAASFINDFYLMPRERIELPYLRLQCNALTAKPSRLYTNTNNL